MFKRRPGNNEENEASAYSRRTAVADSLWTAQDRLRSGSKALGSAGATSLERVGFGLQERAVWPLQDRAAMMGAAARALSLAAAVLLAGGAIAAGLIAAQPDGSSPRTVATQVAAHSTPIETEPSPPRHAEPTLQGAAPVFEPAQNQPPSELDPAKAIVKSSPDQGSAASPETAQRASASAASTSSAKSAEVDGPPAGPEAIAVARDFAGAFLLYETGRTDSEVRTAFGQTATPALSRALLERPPRLPANVEVPKAKVVNVVAAPSHGDVYPVSVSLLRVGLTSELRLDMEEQKGDGWRVTNVLG